MQCSMWCLRDHSGPHHTFIGIRDRAMMLLSTTIVFRGDSSRALLWSDLFLADVPMNDIGLGTCVKVRPPLLLSLFLNLTICQARVVFADNAKHNQTGRTDEFGAFRHHLVELCPIGGMAMLFFAIFHILNMDISHWTSRLTMVENGDCANGIVCLHSS